MNIFREDIPDETNEFVEEKRCENGRREGDEWVSIKFLFTPFHEISLHSIFSVFLLFFRSFIGIWENICDFFRFFRRMVSDCGVIMIGMEYSTR